MEAWRVPAERKARADGLGVPVRAGELERAPFQIAARSRNLLGETCNLVPVPKMTLSVLEDTVISWSTKNPGPSALSVSGTRWLLGAEIGSTGKLQMLSFI